MNTKNIVSLGIMAASLVLAGCESSDYPNSYQIPVSNAQVSTISGVQNTGMTGIKDVESKPGYALYFQAVSPISVNFEIYEKSSMSMGNGGGSRGALLTRMQGTAFDSSVTPNSDAVEFVFTPTFANTAGTVQLTSSDRPISPPLTAVAVPVASYPVATYPVATVPVTTYPVAPASSTTTTTTTTPSQ